MNNFSVNWYFPTMKQLAEVTVFPELDEIVCIQEDFSLEVFQHCRNGEVPWKLFLLIHKLGCRELFALCFCNSHNL